MTASKPEEAATAPAPAAITAGAAERETKPAQETSNITAAEKNEGGDEENAGGKMATRSMDQQENADNAEGDK